MSFGCVLADKPDFGRVFDCGDCGNIHVALGTVSLTLSPTSFLELVALIHSSAANFELWMEHQQRQKANQIPSTGHSRVRPAQENSALDF